jgi:hypothetical protein
MKRILFGFFVCFALFGLNTAHAAFVDQGTPFPGNSWDQQWVENGLANNGQGPYDITHIQMEIISGSTFDTPPNAAIFSFSDASWHQAYENALGTILVAEGSSVNPNFLYFTTAFTDPKQNTVFAYQGYDGSTLVDSETLTWTYDSGWTYALVTYNGGFIDPPVATPEPCTLLLVGGSLGLAGLGALRKKFRTG